VIRLLADRPARTVEHAQRGAAEHLVFSDQCAVFDITTRLMETRPGNSGGTSPGHRSGAGQRGTGWVSRPVGRVLSSRPPQPGRTPRNDR
jgi:hypothetical protein